MEFRVIHESDRVIDELIQNELINRFDPEVSKKAVTLIEDTLIRLNFYSQSRKNDSVVIERLNKGKLQEN